MSDPIRLTQFAKRAGCAAKQPPGYLLSLLGSLPPITDPNVLVGNATADDAAVYKLSNDLALVFTTDFFTPIVDNRTTSAPSPPPTRSATCTRWAARR